MTVLPFHFVPVSSSFPKAHRTELSSLTEALAKEIGHHRYAPGRRSGRILCRLRTVSPIVVGASQESEDGQPTRVAPFKINKRLALPASTLRGMISAVAEAASNSALRVLEKRRYSYRMPMKGSLGAIGEIVVDETASVDDTGSPRFALRPLAMPAVPAGNGFFTVPPEFRGDHRIAPLKVYLHQGVVETNGLETWSVDHPREYGLELHALSGDEQKAWNRVGRVAVHPWMRLRDKRFLLAQNAPNAIPRPWHEIPQHERPRYARGIVRIMKESGRDLADTRHFEVFLPRDPDDEHRLAPLPLDPKLVDRFHRLADERTEATRERKEPTQPYHPVGTERARETDPKELDQFRLKAGDLVYYRAEEGVVHEIALSSIWRRAIEDKQAQPYSAWDFFRAVDPDLVPFSSGRTEGQLTPAEKLFGFVSDDDTGGTLPALAGRLRFAAGMLEGDPQECELASCLLRTLSSPKPPCPPLYFTDPEAPQRAIDKGRLVPQSHLGTRTSSANELPPIPAVPQGRKFYVHQKWDARNRHNPNEWPWRDPATNVDTHDADAHDTDSAARMQSTATPLRDDLSFVFAIDFDNLDETELGLLLYALRPTEKFMHKIGMGKALGLGSVQIDIVGCFEVDRALRYAPQGLRAPRHARVHADGDIEPPNDERYLREREDLSRDDRSATTLPALRKQWRDQMPQGLRGPLERVGEAIFLPGQVSWPRVHGDSGHDKSYEWFVSNDKEGKALQPLGSRDTGRAAEAGWPELPELRPPSKRG